MGQGEINIFQGKTGKAVSDRRKPQSWRNHFRGFLRNEYVSFTSQALGQYKRDIRQGS